MKKSNLLIAGAFLLFTAVACKKDECAECHYDKDGGEVELGEKCGETLEDLEANGYTENGTVYTVHCHEH